MIHGKQLANISPIWPLWVLVVSNPERGFGPGKIGMSWAQVGHNVDTDKVMEYPKYTKCMVLQNGYFQAKNWISPSAVGIPSI